MKKRRRRQSFLPWLEVLELRVVPAETSGTTFVVFRTADDALPGSLRREILDANATSGPVTIDFALGSSGAQTLQPTSALPALTNSSGVIVDGTSEPGFSTTTHTPLVVLDGSLAGAVNGLVITGGNATIKGLVTQNYKSSSAGLVLDSSNNTVQGNFIGTDATGTKASANYYGIYLPDGASNNTIGGTTAAAANVISGNAQFGVLLESSGATGNVVEGNLIGTDASGGGPLANANAGVVIDGARGNTIGGATAGTGNVLSGNTVAGLLMTNTGTSGNVVQGNWIGTNSTGATGPGLGNSDFGILLNGVSVPGGAPGNTIGGTNALAGNVIGNNGQFGVVLNGTNETVLEGNFIGTTRNSSSTSETALPNGLDGVIIDNASVDNTLGGTASRAGNVISGNTRFGVQILGMPSNGTSPTTAGNVLLGNLVGTDASGTTALPNGDDGVVILYGARDNTVGGTVSGAGNVLSGNGRFGLYLLGNGAGAYNNVVEGNFIGVSSGGTGALGNAEDGVAALGGANDNTVGGTASGAGNIIAGNGRYGLLFGAQSDSNLVQGNFIGTNSSGASGLGNKNDGVEITDSGLSSIGGTTVGEGNTIAGNGGNGVLVSADDPTSGINVIQGNFIGTNSAGTLTLGNNAAGVIVINNATDDLIGAPGTASATGAPTAGGNIIANNKGSGVIIGANTTDNTTAGIVGNTIFANGGANGIGIDLGNQGKAATQPVGPGPNDFQPAPVITSAMLSPAGVLTVPFSLAATVGTYRLEFFLNNASDVGPQGRFFLGSQDIDAAIAATGIFTYTPTSGTGNLMPASGQLVTATSTPTQLIGNGNNPIFLDTSEFSSGSPVFFATLAIITTSLANWTVNHSGYGQTIIASNGMGPYTFATTTGNLPPGLMLSSSGVLTGTPTAAGTYNFTIMVTDSTTPTTHRSSIQPYTVVINPAVAITTTSLPNSVTGMPYNQTITATGGTGGLTFTATAGTLPPGLTLSSSGVLSGTPTTLGTYNFTVTATDSVGASGSQSINLSVATVGVSPATLPAGDRGTAYTQTLTAVGGTAPYTFSSTGTLPAGLTLNSSTGVLAGTPTATGTISFTVTAMDSAMHTGSQSYNVTINGTPAISTTALALPNADIGAPFDQMISTTGGTPPFTFSSTSLPAGLTLSTSGVLSVAPTGPTGSFGFTVTATDAVGGQASQQYTIVIYPAVGISTATLPNGQVGVPYNGTVSATGGSGFYGYVWGTAAYYGSPVPGLTQNSATGVISGTPLAAGNYSFIVTATDTWGGTASRAFSITINPP